MTLEGAQTAKPVVTIGSVCSGIGGLDLSVEHFFASLGFEPRVAWQVEHDEFCNKVLARHFPGATRAVRDVFAANDRNLAVVTALCAGFPCQPHSFAGKRGGEATSAGSGPKLPDSFAKFDPATSSWKTSLGFSLPTMDTLTETFSGRWPRAGTMRNGAVFERPTWERPTDESDGSSSRGWPTITTSDAHGHARATPDVATATHHTGTTLADAVKAPFRPALGAEVRLDASPSEQAPLNPAWVECLMGLPVGWTEPAGPQAAESSSTRGSRPARPRKSRTAPRG